MNFDEIPEFQRDLKKLAKKYKSLPADLGELQNVIAVQPLGNSKHSTVIKRRGMQDSSVQNLSAQNLSVPSFAIVKSRMFCRDLKGSSLRIIYAHYELEQRIEFIELYFKGNKELHDKERVKQYLAK